MTMADLYDGRDTDGKYSNEQDAFTAIQCVDNPQSKDQAAQLDAERRATRPRRSWTTASPPTAVRGRLLLLAGAQHERASPAQGRRPAADARDLHDQRPGHAVPGRRQPGQGPRRVLLTFEGTQHTAFLQGSDCVDQYGSAYLTTLKLPPAGTRCTR